MPFRSFATSLIVLCLVLAAALTAPIGVQAGGGCHRNDGSVYTEGPTTIVKMDLCSYAPTIARVPVGTTIRFLNSANLDHMVVGRSGTWASDILTPGSEYLATFKAAGTYPFSCPLHPGMVGAVVVGDGVGVSGGASVGLPAPVVAGGAASSAPSAAAASPVASAAPSIAATAPAPASVPAVATVPAAAAIDPTVLGAAVVIATLGGVMLGAFGGSRLAARRRPGAATSR